MTTVKEALAALTAYPVPEATLSAVAARRGVDTGAEATRERMSARAFRLAEADLLMWLSMAPAVAQGGQSYTLSDEQRAQMRSRAEAILAELDDNDNELQRPRYGYKGTRL